MNKRTPFYECGNTPLIEAVDFIFKEMFSRVNAEEDIPTFTEEPAWFLKYSWTKDQEQDFINWLSNHFHKHPSFKQISAAKLYNNKTNRRKLAESFVWNFGWKTII